MQSHPRCPARYFQSLSSQPMSTDTALTSVFPLTCEKNGQDATKSDRREHFGGILQSTPALACLICLAPQALALDALAELGFKDFVSCTCNSCDMYIADMNVLLLLPG